jgi:mannitol/fructose-specific phosphotransferase system IIA component (Ntr-type)
MTATIYDQLNALVEAGDKEKALDQLVSYLQEAGKYHELFEALKMRLRTRLGLSAAQAEQESSLDDATELELERGLIDACRQVGELFLKAGKIREGWMYMRPVGNRELAAQALAAIEPTDENIDELLEVLLHEGVDVGRGYALSLERMGTCNSITMFEQALAARPRADQQIAAQLLVEHVHTELVANLKRDIAQRQKLEPTGTNCEELLAEYPDVLSDGSYHLDTSHLASTVRFARVLDDADSQRKALDLTVYGRQLHPQYQYPGEGPFLDLYPASAAFFRALLGQQVDAGIRYFTQKADTVDQQQFGLMAVEVLIDLLSRCGRNEEALAAFAKRIPSDARTMGISPTLLQMSSRLGKFEAMQEICKKREDILGFTAALLQG